MKSFVLYKYRSLREGSDFLHTLDILIRNEIYLAVFDEFNDPFDCRLHIPASAEYNLARSRLRELNPEVSTEELEALVSAELSPKKVRENELKIRAQVDEITRSVGIFSMSARRDIHLCGLTTQMVIEVYASNSQFVTESCLVAALTKFDTRNRIPYSMRTKNRTRKCT